MPTSVVLAMEEQGDIAGTASALLGALQMVTGAVVMTISGLFADGTPFRMVVGIATCAIITLGLSQLTLRQGR
jgi:DHA1 family bicyclomycin/chloramphenicol resistance-like MFS transporter